MNNVAVQLLVDRNISIDDLSYLANKVSIPLNNSDNYTSRISNILSVRKIQDLIALGIIIDIYGENNLLPQPLQHMISHKDPLFELDRILAMGVLFEFGPDAIINFSYIQKEKMDIIKNFLDNKNSINTFLDDILAAILAITPIELI